MIKGLTSGELVYHTNMTDRPRAALMLSKNTHYIPLTNLMSKDIASALIRVDTQQGGIMQFVAASVYLDYNALEIPNKLKELVNYCKSQNLQLIIGADANAHHTLWGSSDTNLRGEELLEFISSSELVILNQGNVPTFENRLRKEVLDVTLSTEFISEKIVDWRVSDEPSLSDHKQIRFKIITHRKITETYRNPRNTNWEHYSMNLEINLKGLNHDLRTREEVEGAAISLSEAITASYHSSCPERKKTSNRDVPWWSNKLKRLRIRTRKLFNKAKVTNDWVTYKESLTEYNREIRKAKRESWNKFCEDISKVSDSAKVHKVLAKGHINRLGQLQKPDGSYTADASEILGLFRGDTGDI